MAYLTVNYVSRSLMRTVPVNVILPADKLVFPGQPEPENKPFRMLILLHGILGKLYRLGQRNPDSALGGGEKSLRGYAVRR